MFTYINKISDIFLERVPIYLVVWSVDYSRVIGEQVKMQNLRCSLPKQKTKHNPNKNNTKHHPDTKKTSSELSETVKLRFQN